MNAQDNVLDAFTLDGHGIVGPAPVDDSGANKKVAGELGEDTRVRFQGSLRRMRRGWKCWSKGINGAG
jgi:hypothetical protein